MRRGRVQVMSVILVAGICYGILCAWRFVPYYWDQRVMKEVVKIVGLYWKDLGKNKAVQMLAQEMYNRDVPTYIEEDDCEFREEVGQRRVYCEWTVTDNWPLLGRTRTMHFVVEALVLPSGVVQ